MKPPYDMIGTQLSTKHRAGEASYYAAVPRGHFAVFEDATRYVYKREGVPIKVLRAWIARDFGTRRVVKVSGKYPRYTVEAA